MATTGQPEWVALPVETLNDLLEQIWHTLCCYYDASGKLPDIKSLFEGAPLSDPIRAANIVFVNMLLDIVENVGRFSPWYTRPARAFGLVSIHDPVTGQNIWMLAPEAEQRWQPWLKDLSDAINQNYSFLQAMILVDKLMEQYAADQQSLLAAHCSCDPPRTIQVASSVLEKAKIVCHACLQPFEV
jgi:hypothetical protein